MTSANDKITHRLEELLQLGNQVLSTRTEPPRGVAAADSVSNELFSHWRAGSLSFLKNVFGEDSTHFHEYSKNCLRGYHYEAVRGQAVLKAAKDDIEGGYLKRIADLVSADIFTDFLEMAEYLLEQGYKDPAASLCGAVLEDGLRRICNGHNVTLKSREDISSLNRKLADIQVYNRLVQKQVEVWNEVRNKADHGQFSEYSAEDVKDMLRGVRTFLAERI